MSTRVLIPLLCYNYGKFLEDCLNSIINQSYENWKVVIRNPESTDHTEEVALRYAKNDGRIEYIKENKFLTIGQARNKTINENPEYDLICYQDVDDIMVKNRLEYSTNNIMNKDIIYGNMKCFGCEKEVRRSLPYINYEILLNGNHVLAGTTCFKYNVWEKINGFDEKMWGSSDYDFWLRAALNGFNFKYINKILTFYRVHSDAISIKNTKMQKKDAQYTLNKHLQKKMGLKSKILFYNARIIRYMNKIHESLISTN